jgi:1-deoxy-D-xylulose-5-phosphate reductoisomerase
LRAGGGAPTALNAANEVAVEAFLAARIGFSDVARIVGSVLDQSTSARELGACVSVAQSMAVHHIARDRALALLA